MYTDLFLGVNADLFSQFAELRTTVLTTFYNNNVVQYPFRLGIHQHVFTSFAKAFHVCPYYVWPGSPRPFCVSTGLS